MAHLKYVADNTENTLVTMQDFGFLLRQDSTAYSVGDTVFCSALPSGLLLECITAGTSASSVPNLSGATVDGTVTDGTVTWLVQKFSNSDSGNGAGIEVGDVSGFTAVGKHGRVLLTWTDPSDVVVDNVVLARWKGTLIVRKAGSVPSDKLDGVVVVDSLSRNAYASSAFVDSGLTDGVTYYYRAFPHTTGNTYTVGSSVSCTPDKESVNVPVPNSMTYSGVYQSASFTGYDSVKMSMTGDVGGTNAGSYTAVFGLIGDDYKWSDNSTGSKDVSWSIGKAAGSVSLSPSNLTLTTSNLSNTITVTRTGDGAISAVSSDTSIAMVSLSGTTVTVTAVANGSVTVTVSVAEGTNWLAPTDETVSVAVSLMPASGKTLNEYTWDEISMIAQAGVGEDYFDIGDGKMIELNGKIGDYFTADHLQLGVFILDINHAMNGSAENNIIFGCFKSALSGGEDTLLRESQSGSQHYNDRTKRANMNHNGNSALCGSNYGGWKGCDLRYDILGATSTQPSQYNQIKTTANVGYDATADTLTNPVADTFLAALPSELRSVLRLWTRWVDAVGNTSTVDSNIQATVDAVTLLAEPEIFASGNNANPYEYNYNTIMAYYAAGNSTVKYKMDADIPHYYSIDWWECSPYKNNAKEFCRVGGGRASDNWADYVEGLAPAFKV